MIKAIIFDFGQTLVDSADGFKAAEKKAQRRIFSQLGTPSWDSFLSVYRGVRKEFHDTSILSRKMIWQEVFRNHCRQVGDDRLERWEQDYWDIVKENTRLFPETMAVLKKLAARYKLGMITNTQGQLNNGSHRISLYPDLEKFFEVIVVAGENWLPPKPDPAPFMVCLEKLGIAAAEAAFVGDDWRIDICGARDAGLQPVWLKHHAVSRRWPDVKPDVPVIRRLEPLLDLEALLAAG